jgi:hypothetical protein
VTEAEALAALPMDVRASARDTITLDRVMMTQEELRGADWQDHRRAERDWFRQHLAPKLRAADGAALAYFGAAPIPLALHLGYLVSGWPRADAYLLHHVRKDWSWVPGEGLAPNRFHVEGVPEDVVRAPGDVVVRVSTSQRIQRDDTAEIVSESLAEIDLFLESPGVDAITTPEMLEAVVTAFRDVLGDIHRCRPNATLIHLFAAVPVGLAFKLGTALNPTMTTPVVAYQFFQGDSPRYVRAFIIQEDEAPMPVPLSDADRAKATAVREAFRNELTTLQAFSASLPVVGAESTWVQALQPEIDAQALPLGARALAPLRGAEFVAGKVEDADDLSGEGFRYDVPARIWSLDDTLGLAFARKLESTDDLARGARLFFLHEGIHHISQALTESTTPQIGRFPKVLEEADYWADVYAMLHEVVLTQQREPASELREIAQRTVRTALATMWAFDERGSALSEMQVRRVNRYLIWYWQLLRIGRCQDLDGFVRILAERPFIEIAGPKIVARNERIFYRLDGPRDGTLELCVLTRDGIRRWAEGPAAPLSSLIEGLRLCDGSRVEKALRGIFDQERSESHSGTTHPV